MKEVKIKCLVKDTINIYKYRVMIYNSNKELILDEFTNNGDLVFNFPSYGIYKIIVMPLSNLFYINYSKYVYIHKNFCETLLFCFGKNYNLKKTFTLKLIDKNYKGLPIEKGEIILWQNRM